MIAIASILMTIAHPGIFFPAISSRHHLHKKPSGNAGSRGVKMSEESHELEA